MKTKRVFTLKSLSLVLGTLSGWPERYRYKIIYLILCLSLISNFSQASNLVQTKNNLNQLKIKITQLQKNLTQAKDKHHFLTREITQNQKRLLETLRQLNQTQKSILHTQDKITLLQRQITKLNHQLKQQQQHLGQFINARYRVNKNMPIKLMVDTHPHDVQRLGTYYRYMIRAQQRVIAEARSTHRKIMAEKDALQTELSHLTHLQQTLIKQKQRYDTDKRYQTMLLQSLTQHIHKDEQTLNAYRRNQTNLTRLLTTLNQQSVIQTRHPFTHMRKKLPRPIAEKGRIEPMNNGLLFIAPLGTPVQAVYPGKVVFADWLNGYGLLMIIDHGWGFMTLYANNQALYKQKGDLVNLGDQIATVGHSGGFKQNSLYFEIRQRGKVISPLDWLS